MIDLLHGAYTAQINPHGGGLAALTYRSVDLIAPQEGAGGLPGFRGAVLVPWPNRVGDGHYTFSGADHQLVINEPERGNALHGLAFDEDWRPVEATPDTVTLALRLGPEPGYPFRLDLSLHYALDDSGLKVRLVATNAGDTAAPYGCGFHPYLRPGVTPIDDALLELDAGQRLLTDPVRLLPTGREPVAGSPYDFSTAQPVGYLGLNDAFTGLTADSAGWHRLRAGDVEAWWDDALPWVQLFTPPDRSAIAVEPCTAPPDAFRTGEDLVTLAPGATHRVRWGVGRTLSRRSVAPGSRQ